MTQYHTFIAQRGRQWHWCTTNNISEPSIFLMLTRFFLAGSRFTQQTMFRTQAPVRYVGFGLNEFMIIFNDESVIWTTAHLILRCSRVCHFTFPLLWSFYWCNCYWIVKLWHLTHPSDNTDWWLYWTEKNNLLQPSLKSDDKWICFLKICNFWCIRTWYNILFTIHIAV